MIIHLRFVCQWKVCEKTATSQQPQTQFACTVAGLFIHHKRQKTLAIKCLKLQIWKPWIVDGVVPESEPDILLVWRSFSNCMCTSWITASTSSGLCFYNKRTATVSKAVILDLSPKDLRAFSPNWSKNIPLVVRNGNFAFYENSPFNLITFFVLVAFLHDIVTQMWREIL